MLESIRAALSPMMEAQESLGTVFSTRRNALNALRLVLAGSVIVSHSWHIGGYGPEPQLFDVGLGAWAVLGFFGISGYLITMSRLTNTSSFRYFRARALRILPGLWVSVAFVAFAVAPISAAMRGRSYSFEDAVAFAVHNGFLLAAPPISGPIGETLAGLPDDQLWNAPLWTLFWEAFCYVIIGLLGAVLRPKLFVSAVVVLFGLGTAGLWAVGQSEDIAFWVLNGPMAPLTAFFAGSTIFCFRKHLSFSLRNLIITFGLAGLILATGQGHSLIFLPFITIILMLSLLLPLKRIGSRYDVSYGMYIYGWPVQQCLGMSGLPLVVGPGIFGVVSLLATFPLAWLSCVLIEGPAQRFGRARVEEPKATDYRQREHIQETTA
jgi:peptidoglycan/LPS O-acetylase OafA/YrhL